MNLITFLKKNEFSRKVFGERELKIIEKQLLGISLKQSEKNRLSRDIRPKFEFISKCVNFEEEFRLKKGAVNKKLVEETVEVILEDKSRKEIKKILLFGSMVENEMTVRLDIDIAVEFKEITLKEATAFRARILGRVNDKMDVQVFNVVPEMIKKEIEKKHKVLYENKR
jgi:predicted nucleotidyltransferase